MTQQKFSLFLQIRLLSLKCFFAFDQLPLAFFKLAAASVKISPVGETVELGDVALTLFELLAFPLELLAQTVQLTAFRVEQHAGGRQFAVAPYATLGIQFFLQPLQSVALGIEFFLPVVEFAASEFRLFLTFSMQMLQPFIFELPLLCLFLVLLQFLLFRSESGLSLLHLLPLKFQFPPFFVEAAVIGEFAQLSIQCLRGAVELSPS